MASAVAPSATKSGFAFAQFVPGALAFNVDLLGHHDLRTFAFVEEVPALRPILTAFTLTASIRHRKPPRGHIRTAAP